MHFSSRYCYMLSSDQVYVTSQTKRYLTSIDRLCLRHALFRSHLAFLTLSLSLSQTSSCECLFRWSETIKMRKYHCALFLLFSPPFHFLWLYFFLSDLLLLHCYSLTLESGGQNRKLQRQSEVQRLIKTRNLFIKQKHWCKTTWKICIWFKLCTFRSQLISWHWSFDSL